MSAGADLNDNQPPLPAAIARQAADWIIRRDGAPLTPEEQAAFQAWLTDPAHRDGLARLEGLWHALEVGPADAMPSLPAIEAREPARRPRRRWAGGAIAASLALMLLGTLEDWPTLLRADYSTGLGERRSIALADGSHVLLDSGSAIAVDFSADQRRIRLLKGGALFTVAPDRAHPFTVEAAGGSATALGTAFAVRRHDDQAEIVVTEHHVAVAGAGRSEVVGEGQQARFAATTLGPVTAAAQGATAWTGGRLVIVDRPLGEVLAEIARYRHGYLTVTGPAADQRVSGVYDLDHPLAAVENIRHSLNLRAFRLSDRIIILHR
ncbi:FecR family protein [Novosphingobium rosa]|uniref:FecR family protein n=1 Tax=Novosphingobium rosa TaxID=76978 RepID=UPI0008317667|nr:FecR family protein [Novosphingobium rosa]